ncbi:hypothetical protein [Pedomonas sp. V897]|uniref:hypothetical protein n=1 Tax=Pedomonas sp. V897 TaxID=3446482 RepID=UPI003EE055AE
MSARERLADILQSCGAAPGRWPAGERTALRAALEADPGLRAMAAREAVLDDWLKAWDVPAPRDSAIEALLTASRATAQEVGWRGAAFPPAWVRPMRRRERWLSSGGAVGLAAGIVALLLLAGETSRQAQVEAPDASMIALAFSADQSEGWL